MTEWSDARDRVQARVIEDSISPRGIRLTTMEATLHRFCLAELNTHRTFSRNSESSRAVPFHKRLAKVREHPAIPVVFPAEQKGMQGGDEVEDPAWARDTWLDAAAEAAGWAEDLAEQGVHKSVVNRLLEPFLWHTVVITATEWDGFWEQRCHEAAQPEIRVAAEAMLAAYRDSDPEPLDYGDWHLPFIRPEDWEEVFAEHTEALNGNDRGLVAISPTETIKRISVARCARTSYVTHDGMRSLEADLTLYDRLTFREPGNTDPVHWSPLEHVATPCYWCGGTDETHRHPGNLRGWGQHRHELDVSPYGKG